MEGKALMFKWLGGVDAVPIMLDTKDPDEIVEALLDLRKQAGVPLELVARSYFPLLEYDAQVDLMRQLAEGVAPHV